MAAMVATAVEAAMVATAVEAATVVVTVEAATVVVKDKPPQSERSLSCPDGTAAQMRTTARRSAPTAHGTLIIDFVVC